MPAVPNQAALSAVVIRALRDDLTRRRGLRPHAQLAIPSSAGATTIDDSYRRLCNRYHPESFAAHGPDAVAAAQEIVELLRVARACMRSTADTAPCAQVLHASPSGLFRLWHRLRRRLRNPQHEWA